MFKNVASQSVTLYAVDATTGLPKTGDSANMLFYVSKDDAAVTAIASASGVPTEIDSTNAKGLYKIALSQSETNADKLLFSGKSSTSNIVVVPAVIYTIPASWTIPRVTLTDTLTIYTGNTVQTGDAYAVVNDGTFGNAKLVRSTTPANTLSVDASHLVAVPATQHVIVDSGTVTTLTNLPAITANWLTAAGINAGALNGKGDWLLSSGYTAPDNADIVTALGDLVTLLARVTGSVALNSDMQTLLGRITGAVALAGSAPSWYTAPVDVSANVGAIKAKTDQLTFTVSLHVDATASIGGNVTVGGYASGQDPATLVLDATASGHNAAGSIGQKINAAGSAADPLLNSVPGTYAAGTAGAALGRIGTGTITTTSIVAVGGNAAVTQGLSYYAADGRSLDWTAGAGVWPDLTGLPITFTSYRNGVATFTKAGATVTTGAGSQRIRVELSATESASIPEGAQGFLVTTVLGSGHKVELVSATLTVSLP